MWPHVTAFLHDSSPSRRAVIEDEQEHEGGFSAIAAHSSFVIRHSSFVIRHSSFVIRHSSFVIRHSSFVIRH
jgi:hypothetical protein